MSFLNGQQLNQKTVQSLSISIIINNRMYVFLIVIDTNVINSKGRLEEMNEIEELFHLGLIDINYTSVLPIELDKDFTKYSIKRKHKVSSYEPIFGSLFYGDSIPIEWAGRESKFNEIFEIVVGKKIREAKMNVDFNRNTFRDILNLDLCWINMADYFITNDKNLLNSRNKLYMNGYDVKIVNPKECLNELKTKIYSYFNNYSFYEIAKRLKNLPPILLGSNAFSRLRILDSKSSEEILNIKWARRKMHIKATLYDKNGKLLLKIEPDKEIQILNDRVKVTILLKEIRVTSLSLNEGICEHIMNPPLCFGTYPYKRFSCSYKGDPIFYGRFTPSNHLLLGGKFYNSKGDLLFSIYKDKLILKQAKIVL